MPSTTDGQSPQRRPLNILALDLATRVGFAAGTPPQQLAQLNSGAFDLRTFKKLDCPVKDGMRLALNLEAWLDSYLTFADVWPDLIVYEAPMDPQAKQQSGQARNSASMLLPWHLATKTEEAAHIRHIRCEKVWPITVRNTFIGKSSGGDRSRTKTAVIDRCTELGYLRPGAKEDNQADAIATWHWAQIYYGRWQPPVEILMGQKLAVVGGSR